MKSAEFLFGLCSWRAGSVEISTEVDRCDFRVLDWGKGSTVLKCGTYRFSLARVKLWNTQKFDGNLNLEFVQRSKLLNKRRTNTAHFVRILNVL